MKLEYLIIPIALALIAVSLVFFLKDNKSSKKSSFSKPGINVDLVKVDNPQYTVWAIPTNMGDLNYISGLKPFSVVSMLLNDFNIPLQVDGDGNLYINEDRDSLPMKCIAGHSLLFTDVFSKGTVSPVGNFKGSSSPCGKERVFREMHRDKDGRWSPVEFKIIL